MCVPQKQTKELRQKKLTDLYDFCEFNAASQGGKLKVLKLSIINRPGVAGAVL